MSSAAENQQPSLLGTKRRRCMPNDLLGRFSGKSDFLKYFKEARKSTCSFLNISVQFNFMFRLITC